VQLGPVVSAISLQLMRLLINHMTQFSFTDLLMVEVVGSFGYSEKSISGARSSVVEPASDPHHFLGKATCSFLRQKLTPFE